jgi:hypothetical protein
MTIQPGQVVKKNCKVHMSNNHARNKDEKSTSTSEVLATETGKDEQKEDVRAQPQASRSISNSNKIILLN